MSAEDYLNDPDYYDEEDDGSAGRQPFSVGKGECVKETQKAIGVKFGDPPNDPWFDFRKLKWIPKSVLHDDSEVCKLGDVGDVVVQQWWFEKYEEDWMRGK